MKKNNLMRRQWRRVMGFAAMTAGVLGLTLASTAGATSLDWSGRYRFEATTLQSTTLADVKNPKTYLLHSLILSPKVIAADGIEVVSQFSVLGNAFYPGSQIGQIFGGGVERGASTGVSPTSNNMFGRQAGASSIEVRQLYLNINQEYGQIVIGRAPIEFGLGMTYNAGNDLFDHWGDTLDLVGYKFLVGNLSMMPMIGKVYDYSTGLGRDATDVMVDITYNNPETESIFGIFHSQRTGNQSANDAGNAITGTTSGDWNVRNINLLIGRGWEGFKFKLEAGFSNGNTGLMSGAEEIKTNGYGIVTEMSFPRPNSAWDWKIKAGVVSGDNPTSTNFEGYALNRNYDLAFLMFNHPMGGYDIFRTAFQRQHDTTCTTGPCGTYANEDALDEEAVSNTVFFAPSVTYTLGDRWSWYNSLVFAQLQVNSSTLAGNDVNKNLGFEWDSALIYKPHPRFQWVNQAGIMLPGEAWKEGSVGRDANLNYGLQTKAAITF